MIYGMNPENLAAELDREPFIPLRLHLADGRTVDIQNSGLCYIARLSLYVFAGKAHTSLVEDVQVISVRHIVSVETLSPQKAA